MSARLETNSSTASNGNSKQSTPMLDQIIVTLVPEKKGIFLKHSEYQITSESYKTTVYRRYNDFVNLHQLLVMKFPYRMIPRLPPKQIMMDSLLEERRKGLHRWLRITSRHPILGKSSLLKVFLTDESADHQEHLREIIDSELDEFANLSSDIELPLEDQGRLAHSREIMRSMLTALIKIKRLVDQQTSRLHCQIRDMDEMASIFRLIGSTNQIFADNTFNDLSNGIREVHDKYVNLMSSSIAERINLLLEVLQSHSDLCDRVEKGIISDHQKAVSKMLTINKQKIKGVIRGTAAGSVAALHEQEIQQTGVVGTLGRRSAFSLYCVLQETSLVQEYLQSLPSVILSYAFEESQRSTQIGQIWDRIITVESDKLNSS